MGTENKKYRFFYHYFKQKKCMSVHYKNQCMQCLNVVCFADTETKWNKTQPQLVIRGVASKIERIEDTIIIHK
jgi:hypothetical protein